MRFITEKIFFRKLGRFVTNPEKVFEAAVIISSFCAFCYLFLFTDIYRDTAFVYAMYAREIGRGNFLAGISSRIPMLNVLLAGLLGLCKVETIRALIFVSGFFFVMTCFPLRRLLERYLSPLQAAYGCLLYATAPKMIRFSCAALLESSRIFFLTAALLYFFRTMERPHWKNALVFGASSGLLMVSRGEGLPAGLALLAGLLPFALLFRKEYFRQTRQLCCAVILACMTAFAAVTPFCTLNAVKTGWFVTDMRVVEAFRSYAASPGPVVPAVRLEPQQPKSLSQLWIKRCSEVAGGALRGGYEPYWLLAAAGFFLLLKKKKLNAEFLVPAGVAVIQCAMYLMIVSSYRYYLFLIPLFMVFTVEGAAFFLEIISSRLPEKAKKYLPAAGVLLLIPGLLNGLELAFSRKDRPARSYARWIADYGKKHIKGRPLRLVMDNLHQTAYWSGAYIVNNYDAVSVDLETVRDFDLMIVRKGRKGYTPRRKDIEPVPDAPAPDKITIYRLKQQETP